MFMLSQPRPSILFMTALALPAAVQAQQAPAPSPPQMTVLEEGEPAAVTIRPPQQRRSIQEKRGKGGEVQEIRVETGGSTYYLRPHAGAGSALPGDAQSSLNRGAQWEVLVFDLGGSKLDQQEQPQPAAYLPASPAPAADRK